MSFAATFFLTLRLARHLQATEKVKKLAPTNLLYTINFEPPRKQAELLSTPTLTQTLITSIIFTSPRNSVNDNHLSNFIKKKPRRQSPKLISKNEEVINFETIKNVTANVQTDVTNAARRYRK